MKYILTIIVPVYNLDKYISRCLKSIISLNKNEVQIIIVNDGSTDRTLDKIKQLIKNSKNNIRIFTKNNEGYGSCINLAIKHAKGKYTKIVDGDDWINTDDLTNLINSLKIYNEDVFITSYKKCSLKKSEKISYPLKSGVYTIEELFKTKENYHLLPIIHMLTIKTSILKESLRRMTLAKKLSYLDQEIVLKIGGLVKNLNIRNNLLIYNYQMDRKGQSIDPEILVKKTKEHIAVLFRMIFYYLFKSRDAVREQKNFQKTLIASHGMVSAGICKKSKKWKIFSFPISFFIKII